MATDQLPRALSLAVHELRTPVSIISGYLRMLLGEHGGPLTSMQHQMLHEAARSCARLGALVTEMNELGCLESNELTLGREEVDLATLLDELVSDDREGLDRGTTLSRRGAGRPLLVTGDRGRLSSAVDALIQATLRECSGPGVIVVECAAVTDGGPAWAVIAIGPEAIVRSLIDGACGTPPEFDEWRGGVGLSLPVARRVIEALGGRVWSAGGDRPRAGSALRLPLRAQESR